VGATPEAAAQTLAVEDAMPVVKSASKCFIILLLLIAIYSIIGLIPLLRHLSKLKGLVEKTPS
jgi:hypothetical protein